MLPRLWQALFACRLVPFAFASPIAGTFVDRFSRRKVMIATDLARVVVAVAFLLVNSKEDLWIAYVATILLSTFGAFFEGGKNAATPNLTGKEGLLAGTALDVLEPLPFDGDRFGIGRMGCSFFRL